MCQNAFYFKIPDRSKNRKSKGGKMIPKDDTSFSISEIAFYVPRAYTMIVHFLVCQIDQRLTKVKLLKGEDNFQG